MNEKSEIFPELAKIVEVKEAIRDHHQSLDLRENGGDSAWRTIKRIEQILDMPWVQGAEQARRAEKIKVGK